MELFLINNDSAVVCCLKMNLCVFNMKKQILICKIFNSMAELLKEYLQNVLTGLTNLDEVLDQLGKLGVESMDDLKYVEPEKDLSSVLNIIQSRKLASRLKKTQDQVYFYQI